MARNLSIIILETLFTALCVVLVLVNLKYNHGCGGYDPGSATSRRVALERRLEAMEVEARENAALLHEVIMGLEDRFGITKMMDLRELKKECHAEAAAIVAHLAEDHAPPMPVFGDSSPSEGETTFGDDVYKDDVLAEGGGDDRYGETSAEESPEDDRVVDLPPTEERREACRKWRTDHAVSPGVSWGTLPADLQRTWRDYDCDIFLQDAVQGMLANEGEHAERRESLDAKAASRLDDDFFDDKGDDDVVGDISSIS